MSKVEAGGGPIDPPPPLEASCNYFFFEASRVKDGWSSPPCAFKLPLHRFQELLQNLDELPLYVGH